MRRDPYLPPPIQVSKPVRSTGRIQQLLCIVPQGRAAHQQRFYTLSVVRGIRGEVYNAFDDEFVEALGGKCIQATSAFFDTSEYHQDSERTMQQRCHACIALIGRHGILPLLICSSDDHRERWMTQFYSAPPSFARFFLL